MQHVKSYRENDIVTANPQRLIIMLYDGVIKELDITQQLFEKTGNNFEAINRAIGKAQDIITELLTSLDMERGGDIAKNLQRLYFYFIRVLSEANVKKENTAELKTVRQLMLELRDAWVQIASNQSINHGKQEKGVNLSG